MGFIDKIGDDFFVVKFVCGDFVCFVNVVWFVISGG